MKTCEDNVAADAVLATSRFLVGIAVRSLQAGSSDVTVAQQRVLVLLEEHGPLTVNQVADLLGVNQSNASRHCHALGELGLVDRHRAAHDGRTVEVRLTVAGNRQVDAVRRARRDEITAVLSRMSGEAMRDMVSGCSAFNEAASGPVSQCTPID